jgi:hypothetical protein
MCPRDKLCLPMLCTLKVYNTSVRLMVAAERQNVSLHWKPRPTQTDSEIFRKETTFGNRKLVFTLMVSSVFIEGMDEYSCSILRPWNYIHGSSWDVADQWQRGLRHELSSPARTLGSWVRILFKTLMSVLVAGLRRVDHSSKEFYRLCKILRNWRRGQGPTKGCSPVECRSYFIGNMEEICVYVLLNSCLTYSHILKIETVGLAETSVQLVLKNNASYLRIQ